MVPNVVTVDPEGWHLATKLHCILSQTTLTRIRFPFFGTTQLLTTEISCKLKKKRARLTKGEHNTRTAITSVKCTPR